jgi:ABC-2 type transport system ATP-binding protein
LTETDCLDKSEGVIEVLGLTKAYGPDLAVDDLSFAAPAGAVTGFVGPNGAGKTTTFRCLLGLESMGFHPARSGRNHLRVISRAAGLDPARIDDLLEVVGLRHAADRRVGGYSLGMRQRLGLAAAMLGDPPAFVLDEPVNGLDPEGVAWVRQLLRAWADQGRTVLVSSHLLAELAQVVDRVVMIRDGRLVAETDVSSLADAVTVRVDRPDALARALRAAGVEHVLGADGAISVPGRDPAEVGRIAATAAVAVLELGRTSAGASLEAMFFTAMGGNGHE